MGRATAEDRIIERVRAQDLEGAATLAIRAYGPEIMSYLCAVLHDRNDAGDAFGGFSQMLWEGLGRFRGDCSVRTWAYVLARRALAGSLRQRAQRARETALSPAVEAIADKVRTETLEYLKTASRERIEELRDSMPVEDRMLLILRVNRKLPWIDVARVLSDDAAADPEALAREAAALRKRFERIKNDLKRLVVAKDAKAQR